MSTSLTCLGISSVMFPLRHVDHKDVAVPGDLVCAVALLVADIDLRLNSMGGAYCCTRVESGDIKLIVARRYGHSFCWLASQAVERRTKRRSPLLQRPY